MNCCSVAIVGIRFRRIGIADGRCMKSIADGRCMKSCLLQSIADGRCMKICLLLTCIQHEAFRGESPKEGGCEPTYLGEQIRDLVHVLLTSVFTAGTAVLDFQIGMCH